jgi:hypothetical protein
MNFLVLSAFVSCAKDGRRAFMPAKTKIDLSVYFEKRIFYSAAQVLRAVIPIAGF